MKRHVRQTAIIVAALSTWIAWPSAAERRPITEKDLFNFVWVAALLAPCRAGASTPRMHRLFLDGP